MSVLTGGMIGAGIATLIAGLILVRTRFAATSGAGRVLVLGPVFEAVALAIFAALFFLIIVATVDLPNLPKHIHERLFWTLTVRETAFAGGAMVLAGSLWPRGISSGRPAGIMLIMLGRSFVACTFVFYAIEHFFFPRFVPGVPLEKMIPSWVPAPVLLSYIVGITLLAAGPGLMIPRTRRNAAAIAGTVLLLLTIFFYVPLLITEIHTPLAVEGVNYVGDTLLFAATALLAAFSAD